MQPTVREIRDLRLLTVLRIEGLFTDLSPSGMMPRWPLLWRRTYPALLDQPLRTVNNAPARCRRNLVGKPSCMTVQKCPSSLSNLRMGYATLRVTLWAAKSSPSLRAWRVLVIFPLVASRASVLKSASSNSVGLAPVESGRESVSGVSQRNRPRPFCVYAKVKRSCGRMKAEGAFTLRRVVSDRAGHPPTRRVRSKHSHSNTIYGVNSRLGAFFTQVFLSAEGCR
jgi:hypothetical protein